MFQRIAKDLATDEPQPTETEMTEPAKVMVPEVTPKEGKEPAVDEQKVLKESSTESKKEGSTETKEPSDLPATRQKTVSFAAAVSVSTFDSTARVNGKSEEPEEQELEDPYYNDDFGIGMSGGGVRSAAFCSGVLWGLMNQGMLRPVVKRAESSVALPRGKIPKFYSCVSGGGYIGASFLWWARSKGGGDPREWQDDYFGRMRRGIGYYVNFTNPCRALWDVAKIMMFASFLLLSGFASFLPSTYILSEVILLPYSIYYNALQDHLYSVQRRAQISLQGMDLGTFFATDIAWLVFLLVCSGIPLFKCLNIFFWISSEAELKTVFLTDTSTRAMRISKSLREMFANLYWYLAHIFSTYCFVVLCDFSDIYTTSGAKDVYHSAVADCLRAIILLIVFSRSPDLIANFLQAQIVIWAYRPPHRFFGVTDTNFDAHYEIFAIICKVLLPVAAVVALFRERVMFEYARYRISKAFFDCPETRDSLTTKGMICGAEFGENSIRKLFWNPPEDKSGHYPVYISGTTVNKWMITPLSSELFPLPALVRELEAKFYFKSMPPALQPRIERILANGEDRATQDQQNFWGKSVGPDSGSTPEFLKQHTASERAEILSFTQQTIKAHETASNSAELATSDLNARFGFISEQAREVLAWMSSLKISRTRQASLPLESAKHFIGEGNIAYIDAAVKIAKEAMMNNSDLRTKAIEFENKKMQVATALRRSLRELAWRSITPESAGFDILALSSEGWWERYEAGLNEPIYVLPPSSNETAQAKLDAIVGANPDISLTEAMGMSAAVGSLAQEIKVDKRSLRQSQVIFGLHAGRWVNTVSIHWVMQLTVMLVAEALLCLPILIWGGLDDPFSRTAVDEATGTSNYDYAAYGGGIATMLLYAAWAFLLPLMKGSKFYPFFPHSRLTATLSGEDVWDHSIPSMIYLSDGGHVENLGLLPLLNRRLKWIVLACGSDEECNALQSALDQARLKLGVSFREIKADQARRAVKRVANKELDLKSDIEFFARDALQRIMVFEVLYPRAIRSWKKSAGSFAPTTLEETPQEKGYIFFMQPVDAHPTGFKVSDKAPPEPSDVPYGAPCIEKLSERQEPLHGCCCRCCHPFAAFHRLGGKFPYHSTTFQCFTPTMFDAYHAQGVRAMKDALEIVLDKPPKKSGTTVRWEGN